MRRYGYQYDGLNRLLKGIYQEPQSSVPQNNFYNEEQSYDLSGNILTLRRNQAAYDGSTALLLDNLNYNYNGNKLTSVTDTSGNYGGYPDVGGNTIDYDANGNMKTQKDKGILQIDYNLLNLPKEVKFDATYIIRNKVTGESEERNVRSNYLYRADGTKLKKKYIYFFNKGNSERIVTTDYLDGFQYTTSYAGLISLNFVPTSEGYFDFEKNKYIYNYSDHLGNVRLSYFHNGSSIEVLEENNYYPFGLKHEGYNGLAGNPSYNYKYNGKELQETGMYDYGARFYMPDIGRWGAVVPLAEMYRRYSPYNYTVNNPINFTDPDGRWVRGAGFWNNLTKSDARIHAEQWTDKLGSGFYNTTVNKDNNGTWKVSSHTTNASYTDNFNSKGLVNTLIIPYSEGGGLGTAPSSGNPWGPSFSSVPESCGKTDIQMLVSENPAVQGAAIDLFTGGAGSALSSLRTAIRIRRLSSQVERTAADIYAAGGAPSAVAGAELNGQTVIGISGQHPSDIAPH